MNFRPPLSPDGAAIAQFVSAMFRYADEGTFVSLRAFHELEHKVFFINAAPVGSDLTTLSDVATRSALRAANNLEPAVFCPPIATFSNAQQAREVDLANGLALSVECDKTPSEARSKLEALLGPATVVVASGGEWTDTETGEIQDKLHLHWRLTEPAREVEEHATLKRVRKLAQLLVGADHSNVPMVHPIRWPGSWHRKGAPRLAKIEALNDAQEIDLAESLSRLVEAITAAGIDENASGAKPGEGARPGGENGSGETRDTAQLIQAILQAEDYHGPIAALAMRFLKAGMPDAQAVLTLRGIMLSVPEAIRDMKDGKPQLLRWQARFDDIPRAVSTARDKVGDAPAASATADPDSPGAEWPDPFDFINDAEVGNTGRLRPDHIPEALRGFVFDTAQRMGTDPSGLALFCIGACASVVPDDWKIQPKIYDYTWTEQPRIWAGIVAGPSFKKSPTLKAATAPIDRLDAEARRLHQQDMRRWEASCEEAKEQGLPKSQWPRQPKLPRYLVENTTMEALTEVLRDDDKATQYAPAEKVLVRQDEMAGWLGDMDRYAAGGRGGGDRGHYLKLYNGGRNSIDRVGRGHIAIPNWSGCVMGGIQPEPIQRIAKEADDDGLLQRFLFCVPGRVDDGEDRAPDQNALRRYGTLFPALAALRPAEGMDGHQPVVFHADGHEHRQATDELLKVHKTMPDNSVRMKASLDKWHGTYARLALIFHLIEIADRRARGMDHGPLNVLSAENAERAARYMEDVLLPHLYRAEAMLYNTPQTGHARWIAGFILTNDNVRTQQRVGMRELVQAYGALRAPERHAELRAVMLALEGMGWVKAATTRPGREVHAWEVNPKLEALFATWTEAEQQRRERVKEQIAKMTARRGRRKAA